MQKYSALAEVIGLQALAVSILLGFFVSLAFLFYLLSPFLIEKILRRLPCRLRRNNKTNQTKITK